MISLTQVSEIFKKYLWVFGLTALVVLLVGLIFLRYLAKEPPPKTVIQKPHLGTIAIKTGNFKFDNLKLPLDYPKELPIYDKQDVSLLGKALSLAQKLDVGDNPTTLDDVTFGQGLLYSNEKGALSVYKTHISYQKFPQKELPEINQLDSVDTFKQKALALLAELGLPANLSSDANVIYWKAFEEFLQKVEAPQEADFLTLGFNFQIDNIPLLGASKIPYSLTFSKVGDVTNFTYNAYAIGQAGEIYPVISPQDAAQELLKGSAKLIAFSAPNTYNPPPKNFNEVDLREAQLAYFYPQEQELIQPVWIFYGTYQEETGATQLIYAVSAIPQNLFKKTP